MSVMTESEFQMAEVAAALNALALAIVALVVVLIVMSWSLDDMALRVHLFGFMLRRRETATKEAAKDVAE